MDDMDGEVPLSRAETCMSHTDQITHPLKRKITAHGGLLRNTAVRPMLPTYETV